MFLATLKVQFFDLLFIHTVKKYYKHDEKVFFTDKVYFIALK